MLLGRAAESEVLADLVQGVQAGRGRVLVITGDPGVGKTSLLDDAAARAVGRTLVVRVIGVQSEMEVPYAGIQQLLDRLGAAHDELPSPQRHALDVALGRVPGATNRYLVGLAVLGLLTRAARSTPLLCLVDDVHWLDRASTQALAFVARRLEHEPLGMLFVRRTALRVDDVADLPVLDVRGLRPDDGHALLVASVPGLLDVAVARQLVREVDGNPLALLELVRSIPPEVLAGGFGLARPAPTRAPLEAAFRERVLRLPAPARTLLLLAAADPTGETALFWRAAEELSVDVSLLAPAVDDGLVAVDGHVRFQHPLVRSAAYGSATPGERRRAHAALAAALRPGVDPDRRAWHRALAALGPDEDVAAELELSALSAEARGGLFAAGAFLERSVELTADPARRSRRALAAARTREIGGALDAALRLVAVAEAGPLEEGDRAAALHVRGRVALTVERGSEATSMLMEAARRMDVLDPTMAREVHLEALTAALFAADLDDASPGAADVAAAARASRLAVAVPGPVDDLLAAYVALVLDGPHRAAAPVGAALRSWRDPDLPPEALLRWSWLACRLAGLGWDERTWGVLAERGAEVARSLGSVVALPAVLSSAAALQCLTGDPRGATASVSEAEQAWRSVGLPAAPYGRAVLVAWHGEEPEASSSLDDIVDLVRHRGEGMGVAMVHWARALRANASGDYAAARSSAQAAAAFPDGILYVPWALAELVESAARTGAAALGRDALDRLAASTRSSPTQWGGGVTARCRALLAGDAEAERWHRESIELLTAGPMVADLARSRLAYGEWLRRRRRVSESRVQLRAAAEVFTAMGATTFARRAGAEAAAAGHDRAPVPDHRALSPQESRVALLASEGLSNAEIGSRLFISASTVDYHLRKVFQKLGVRSRTRLHLVLPAVGVDGVEGADS